MNDARSDGDTVARRREEPKARVLAYYLPQFHPIPENDEWWGAGFTEWTNTAKARPRFPRHYQPHIPAELGFYDLRVAETRSQQADLAHDYGIEGFLYWHYWFAGRRILQRPFDEVLRTGEPDFPFALAWANQTWTGIWHGAPNRVLIEQTYPGPEDDSAHFQSVLSAFVDPRYINVDGRPLFYVFRPEQLPNPAAFVERWQTMAARAGLPGLYLVAEVSDLLGRGATYATPSADGFDAAVHIRIPAETTRGWTYAMRAARRIGLPEMYPYARRAVERPPLGVGRPLLPCVYPNWDNTPRSGSRGLAIWGSSPERFRTQLHDAVERVRPLPECERLVFIKSWNEWAEGNHLEPDQRWGRGYLEAVRAEVLR